MLNFRDITIDDKDFVDSVLKKLNRQGCEACFANNLAWSKTYGSQIAVLDDGYIIKTAKYVFGYNVDMECEKSDASPDFFDYIYEIIDLINLSGSKYHSKRNHLKKAEKYTVDELSEKYFSRCKEIPAAEDDEANAIEVFFKYYKELKLDGIVLLDGEKVIGYAVGSVLNSDTYDEHIEKGLKEYDGVYVRLLNEFVKYIDRKYDGKFKYLNREEDLGIPGLRKSKKSWHPVYLLSKKYSLTEFTKFKF
ncbi:MAG: phosphatidylglycerol lysyltransferase domain-containing protein [Ruminococcus sp.]|jgi:hypothetical protein|nr:phosphatidylglycerol lysyltransferase domain-containing protein [Ruminococcus sp.]